MHIGIPGWTGRSQVERVRIYTIASLHLLMWFFLGIGVLGAGANDGTPQGAALALVVAVALGALATPLLSATVACYPTSGPLPWRWLTAMLVAEGLLVPGLAQVLPQDAGYSTTLLLVGALAWSAGGLRGRVQWLLGAAFALIGLGTTGHVFGAFYGLGLGYFVVFTVHASLWVLGVMTELDDARASQAALAVAEERLRFSRDVHDVLGRRLSTIAVQAELAGTLAQRGDDDAVARIRDVRDTAHHALREARELARGYRPLDLATEVEGAVSLLRSAGVETHADLGALPEAWHEPVARLIREAVTNVLRHSRAGHVDMTYDGREIVIRNDGVTARAPGTDGSGLAALTEDLAPMGVRVRAEQEGDSFVVRAELAGVDR